MDIQNHLDKSFYSLYNSSLTKVRINNSLSNYKEQTWNKGNRESIQRRNHPVDQQIFQIRQNTILSPVNYFERGRTYNLVHERGNNEKD